MAQEEKYPILQKIFATTQTFAPAKNTETSVRAIDKIELTRADVRDQRPGVGHVVAARGSGQKAGSLRTSQK